MARITPELLESYLKNELDPQTTEFVDPAGEQDRAWHFA
jgi:hypothetical protein